jgi:hypothetical protein
MSVYDLPWSKSEKAAARKAFEAAYQRECAGIADTLKTMLGGVAVPADLWRLHDYLAEQRHRTDEKYDYRYSVLPFVLARLLKEGWLAEADLHDLSADKLEIIKFLAGP